MGPTIRNDIVDVYVFRRRPAGGRQTVEFLQMHRVPGIALPDTWQPVMGHMEEGETAARTALRELREETGYAPGDGLLGFWHLELVNTYFLHAHENIVMSPCFAAEVVDGRDPVMDHTHDALRWVTREQADRSFLWPGQRTSIQQILRDILDPRLRKRSMA